MRKVIAVVIGTLVGTLAGVIFAQTAKPKYDPTEVQSLRLQVKQKTIIIDGQQLQAAQNAYNADVAALVAESKKTINEQKWPDTTQFDLNNLTFCDKMVQGQNGQMVCPVPGQEAKK